MKDGAYYGLNVRGFILDFFGALVPGLLFIFLSFFALGWPIWLFMKELQILIASNATPPLGLFKQVRELSTVLTVELSILLLVASYVIGTLFFAAIPKPRITSAMNNPAKNLTRTNAADGWCKKMKTARKMCNFRIGICGSI